MVDTTKTHVTAADYRAMPVSERREELLNGEIIVSPSPVEAHQSTGSSVLKFLFLRLPSSRYLRYESDIYLTDVDVPRPDIFWIRPDSTDCVLMDNYWHGAPDLIIEILSPSTAKYDRGYKYNLYERCGVREYWLVDPQGQFLEVYALTDGRYQRLGLFEKGQTFTSPALGFEIPLNALFEETEA